MTAAAALAAAWTAATGAPPRAGERFAEAGGDSIGLMEVVFALEAALGPGVRPALSIGMTAADMLAALAPPAPAAAPVFVFPALLGDLTLVGRLRQGCGPGLAFCGIDYGPWDRALRPEGGPDGMVGAALAQIAATQPAGPLRLVGFCAGAWPALAVAARCAAAGREVARLILLDAAPPGVPGPDFGWRRGTQQAWRAAAWEAQRLWQGFGDGSRDRRLGEHLARLLALRPARPALRAWARRRSAAPGQGGLGGWTRAYLGQALRIAAWRAAPFGAAPALAGRAVLLRCREAAPGAAPDYGWGGSLPGLRVAAIPGSHDSMLDADLPTTAAALRLALAG